MSASFALLEHNQLTKLSLLILLLFLSSDIIDCKFRHHRIHRFENRHSRANDIPKIHRILKRRQKYPRIPSCNYSEAAAKKTSHQKFTTSSPSSSSYIPPSYPQNVSRDQVEQMVKSITTKHVFRALRNENGVYVVVSTYRISPDKFAIIGEGKTGSKIFVDYCYWKNSIKNFTHETRVSIFQGGWSVGYFTAVALCKFKNTIGQDRKGGTLHLGKSKSDMVQVYEELPSEYNIAFNRTKYSIAFCSPPMFGNINREMFSNWIHYYDRVLEVEHFGLYDYGGVPPLMPILYPFILQNRISITKMIKSKTFSSWYYHQQTNNNDCLYRNRLTTKWVVFVDFDELIYVPPHTSLRAQLRNVEKPWASMGSYSFRTHLCDPRPERAASDADASRGPRTGGGPNPNPSPRHDHGPNPSAGPAVSPYELLVWRHRRAKCTPNRRFSVPDANFCPVSLGHRKIIVKPRESYLVHIHKNVVPNNALGLVWNASMDSDFPKIFHFHRILVDPVCACTVSKNVGSQAHLYGMKFEPGLRRLFISYNISRHVYA